MIEVLLPVDMNSVGAGDIVVGQTWVHVVTYMTQRLPWVVVGREFDHVVLERDGETQRVSFGALLSTWHLHEVVS